MQFKEAYHLLSLDCGGNGRKKEEYNETEIQRGSEKEKGKGNGKERRDKTSDKSCLRSEARREQRTSSTPRTNSVLSSKGIASKKSGRTNLVQKKKKII